MKPNGIHPSVLKELDDVIAGSLSFFHLSWESGEAPVVWKRVNIFSILRKQRTKTLVITDLSVSL